MESAKSHGATFAISECFPTDQQAVGNGKISDSPQNPWDTLQKTGYQNNTTTSWGCNCTVKAFMLDVSNSTTAGSALQSAAHVSALDLHPFLQLLGATQRIKDTFNWKVAHWIIEYHWYWNKSYMHGIMVAISPNKWIDLSWPFVSFRFISSTLSAYLSSELPKEEHRSLRIEWRM